jgi:hypothetical protein
MKRRYAVLGLSVFLAIALAVPAFGGPTNPIASLSASAKGIANKALKKAKTAETTAKSAVATANGAAATANSAADSAKTANTTANSALTKAAAAQTAASAAQTTATSAKSLAEAANANANNRIRVSEEVIGTANPSTGTNTTTAKSASAECPAGQFVLGGGFFVNGEPSKVTVGSSDPNLLYGNGWIASGEAISGTPTWSIQAEVMCGVK